MNLHHCVRYTLAALLLPAGLVPASTPAVPGRIVLAKQGRSAYSICLSAQASPAERRGAEELQRFLEQMSGARLPLATECSGENGDSRWVLVGRSAALDRLKLDIPFDRFGSEGFVIKTAGRHLVIAGGQQRGTMYGVYALLESLGCRWFTREVSRIPKMSTVAVGPMEMRQKPAFEYREPFFTEAFDKDWAARNKMNGAHMELNESTGGKLRYYPFVHTFYQMIPPEKYFRDHPEYFSLIDGKRRAERGQLCLTNPEVLRLSVEAVLGWIGEHPEATIYSVSQNDWEGWCECDRCRQVEQEEGGAHSGPILRFVNALAEQVAKRHPEKLIDTLAYWYSEPPPLKARPRPNVRIRLCPINACEAHAYEACPYNAEFMKNLRGWSRITDQLYIWHYVTNFAHYLLPFPDFDELAADIPMYKRHGVVGLFLEGAYPQGGGGENAELRSYVMARLLWDPAADVNREVNDFLAGVYAKAAAPMRAYFDLLHRQVRTPPKGAGQHMWIRRSPNLPAPVNRRAQALFRQAEAAAENEEVRDRVRKARLPLDYYELLNARTFIARDGSYAPARLDFVRQRFPEFVAALRRFGITSIHEGVDLKEDERQVAALRSYPVVSLRNAFEQVDLVPELNGRIVRMVNWRTGADAIRPADPGGHVAGLTLAVYPDFHSRVPLEVTWDLERLNEPRAIALAGTGPGDLSLRRTLRLAEDEPVLHTITVINNNGSGPVSLTLQSRLDLNPGHPRAADIELAFTRRDGAAVRKKLLAPGAYSAGSETYSEASLPDGQWRFVNRGARLVLLSRFPKGHAERCTVNWRARGENRVNIGVWSGIKTLQPGESFQFEVDYGLQ